MHESNMPSCVCKCCCGCGQPVSLCVSVWQDAYWTTGRSVLLGESHKLHPHKKHVAVDGRVRTTPGKDQVFSMFWAVTRTQVTYERFACLVRLVPAVFKLVDVCSHMCRVTLVTHVTRCPVDQSHTQGRCGSERVNGDGVCEGHTRSGCAVLAEEAEGPRVFQLRTCL
jgi:hypothetical protein